jgi:hypothetical protein
MYIEWTRKVKCGRLRLRYGSEPKTMQAICGVKFTTPCVGLQPQFAVLQIPKP